MSDKGIVIRIDGEAYKRLTFMQKALQLKNATETVRYCIGKEWLYLANEFPNVVKLEEEENKE